MNRLFRLYSWSVGVIHSRPLWMCVILADLLDVHYWWDGWVGYVAIIKAWRWRRKMLCKTRAGLQWLMIHHVCNIIFILLKWSPGKIAEKTNLKVSFISFYIWNEMKKINSSRQNGSFIIQIKLKNFQAKTSFQKMNANVSKYSINILFLNSSVCNYQVLAMVILRLILSHQITDIWALTGDIRAN